MAKNRSNDFVDFLRSSGLRKRVAKALSDLEEGGRGARGNAERAGKRVIADLRAAADEIEKRLNLGSVTKKATRSRKRTTKRRPAAKKSTARKSTARKTSARKSTAKKTTARKSTAKKTSARKTSARKASPRKTGARQSTGRKTSARKRS